MSPDQLNTTEFTSRASAKRPSGRISSSRVNKTSVKRRSSSSALLGVCTLMLCCALLLSVAFVEEPFVSTMTGSGGDSVTDDILGRLTYLCEQFAGVFLPNHELKPPVKGEVIATFQATGGWVEFFGDAGCDVYACADGIVTLVAFGDDGGKIELTLANGDMAVYTCLGEVVVELNQPVSAGDAIAVSPSGRVLFTYERSGVAQDPLPLMGLSSK